MKNIKAIVIISCVFVLFASCNKNAKTEINETDKHEYNEEIVVTEAQMQAVGIELGSVEMRELNSVIRANGQLILDPQKKAEVTSLLGGIVEQILVTEGKRVGEGQIVAYLGNTEIVELQKNYIVLKKESMIAEQEFNRQKDLSSQGAGTLKTLQQATANYDITKAQLAGLEKQLQQLSISPEQVSTGKIVTRIPLKSPITGYINKIHISTGSYVSTQTSLMNITDNTGIHCDVKIFEKDLNNVSKGQEVDILLTNLPNETLKGQIYDINKSFEDNTKTIIVHIELQSNANVTLLPNMYVTALINTGRQKVEAVPNNAIISKEGKRYIFVLTEEQQTKEEKTFHFEPLEVICGVSELGYTQITPVGELKHDARIIKSNAFYVGSMSTEHGEHNH